jgi:hypothetical protein
LGASFKNFSMFEAVKTLYFLDLWPTDNRFRNPSSFLYVSICMFQYVYVLVFVVFTNKCYSILFYIVFRLQRGFELRIDAPHGCRLFVMGLLD